MNMKCILFMASQVAFFSCGSNLDSTTKTMVETEQRLIVVHGGFNSCGGSTFMNEGIENFEAADLANVAEKSQFDKANVFDSFHFRLVAGKCKAAAAQGRSCSKVKWLKESIVDRLEEQEGTNWFVSCQPFDTSTLLWVDSRNPAAGKSGSREEMWSDLVKFSEGKGQIHIAGHSYGGWTAMHSVIKLGTQVQQLSTLDPISVRKCTPGGVSVGSRECMRFPSDIGEDVQRNVRNSVDSWKHYWQTVDNGGFMQLGLHSGPVEIEDVDQKKLPVSHTGLNVQESVWMSFIDQI